LITATTFASFDQSDDINKDVLESEFDLSFRYSRTSAGSSCLEWQRKYIAYTKTFPTDSSLVYHSRGGLSDSLTGMVSAFVISYSLGRTFCLSNDNILWKAMDSEVAKRKVHENTEKVGNIYHLHKKRGIELIQRLQKIKREEVHITGNRGSVFKIVSSKEFDKFDKLQLRYLGSEYVFGCLLNLLTRPTERVLDSFRSELLKLKLFNKYKIGLQIRTFETLRGVEERTEAYYLRKYKLYADCVMNIAKSRRNVVIFVLSDSSILRQAFVAHFQSHGLESFTTSIDMLSIKAPWWASNSTEWNIKLGAKLSPAEAAFGESFLFSLNDIYVYTKKSGFGRVGAASGMGKNVYFPVGDRKGSITSPNTCFKEGFSMKEIEHDSAGLR